MCVTSTYTSVFLAFVTLLKRAIILPRQSQGSPTTVFGSGTHIAIPYLTVIVAVASPIHIAVNMISHLKNGFFCPMVVPGMKIGIARLQCIGITGNNVIQFLLGFSKFLLIHIEFCQKCLAETFRNTTVFSIGRFPIQLFHGKLKVFLNNLISAFQIFRTRLSCTGCISLTRKQHGDRAKDF